MKKQILAALIFGCFTLINNAQNLKGLIVNELNQPLEAVYVYNLDSKNHTHTSENGVFVIVNTKIGDSIRVGLLGYKTKTLVVKDASDIKIILEEKVFQLDEMALNEELNPVRTISRLDLKVTPVNSSQEVLRKVPGLFIGQHAGGGKAEQIFLRGFDIDHGTDVSISVDGMPVNMVSHAHGQGYSDLHFVIPETVNKIDFGKGSYYAQQGDFNTAGYVGFKTKDYLKESSISFSAGQFNTLRTVGLFNLLEDTKNKNAYAAIEYIATDGPFESPQNFNRLNLFGKYVMFSPENDKITLTASHFTSRWDASGQIPQREVDNGNITRFGAIDDTEGGTTERTNFNVTFDKYITDNTKLSANAFYSHYAFELYSNFTFFLEDEVNGDQIKQKEDRNIFGANTAINYSTYLGETEFSLTTGLSVRHDIVDDVELSRTLNRTTTLENIQLGDINQTNMSGFVNTEFEFGKFKIAPALRLDYFKFLYNDALQTDYETKSETKTILSPKLNLFYNANNNLQLYIKSGIGFHSNDTRVVVANEGKDILPRSYGLDLGTVWKPSPKLVVNTALWYLFLEQEFVYVGDAGIVEPSGKTRRYGLDLGLRYQFNDWLFLDTDATLTDARSIEEANDEDYIPLAPDFTLTGGLSVDDLDGFSGGLRFRYLDDRAANEDNSIVAEGYLVTDLNLNYQINKITLGIAVENLFDVDWNETQFATESRLQNEAQSVEEIHFTPGTPFFIKGTVSYNF
ncbi:TonB-dependent receptor plug domain-containing protein [Winogradskyella echinorum]|uniref:TonB-dependent receptor plug domain-containing protein n=1 Tax=Winogradskyella echinorum TaxID=538189 RepID=A0ABR6Y378_9FLAO|nr:TonB-dependent receptor [Winogradskyella echinorum]MBC3847193.1 TonB-dependent receptor plug domain-containing protein [Winogradskyella echinorum]MBC5751541.1 TonB-dependent receptor plug domain-containing protein [Winogradskyella echinorum]